ncbi:bifunctional D-cysteine desulfhydrase/1-aminocyclopropane-1-carboxylate deaminase, mitochondrial-like [Anneissia japonica]|uniref:bifunctional D-cysteine desulfhydrase/1-aminocyclopropane-1-carboxylate deaminase, mitochondrial-like n=1 Tax=Anneissia japonica TaxID=1529436 RepID=UPI0014259B12|nr:bifunctional D-cysteine desulfhydrase/1-aminocyclopropane-1-carboxylate deaminase, mitochondrial-like [Anneissia japonica]
MMIAFKVKALICQVKINHLRRHLLLATTNHRCQHTKSNSYKLLSYRPPDWASHLQMIPLVKVKLFQPFTPIHKWSLPNIPDDIDIYIKRDDMTGSVLSGNKVRKLEFLLGEALATGCQAVITCGGVQSNHCRTTAVAAKQLGIETHLLLRSRSENLSETSCHGNMLLNSLMGASMYLVPIKAQEKTDLEPRMQRLADRLQEEKGMKAYLIPIGGSNVVGLHGYLCGWQELLEQGVTDRFDDVILTVGSGGTAAGVAIGNFLYWIPSQNSLKQ